MAEAGSCLSTDVFREHQKKESVLRRFEKLHESDADRNFLSAGGCGGRFDRSSLEPGTFTGDEGWCPLPTV